MLLEHIGLYNDLSPAFRKKLEEKVKSFGDRVQYRFHISNPNPDPDKYNGDVVWPSNYTLDPAIIRIIDKEEKRADKSSLKQIALITKLDEKSNPYFGKLRVYGRSRGILDLDLTKTEDFAKAMYAELHPKLIGGDYQDKDLRGIIERIDVKKESTEQRKTRNERAAALQVATKMSEKEIKEFAAAMTWDENIDLDVLRNQVENLADHEPQLFNGLIASQKIKYQAIAKRAIDQKIILFDPLEYKYSWGHNQQLIVMLSQIGNKNPVERLGDWLAGGEEKTTAVYQKLEEQVK